MIVPEDGIDVVLCDLKHGDAPLGIPICRWPFNSKYIHTKDLTAEHYTAIQRIKKRPAWRLSRSGGWAGNGRSGVRRGEKTERGSCTYDIRDRKLPV